MLMLMQLGFLEALYAAATLVANSLRGELVMISPQYDYLVFSKSFSQRRLYQALAFDGVESVGALYMGMGNWKNPESGEERTIWIMGFNPLNPVFDLPGLSDGLHTIQRQDVVLFDAYSRPEFGPIARMVRDKQRVISEVNGRRIEVGGLFELGVSFGANGNLITSDQNFLRLFGRHEGVVDIGLIRLKPGADPGRVRDQLSAALPKDVRVLTRAKFVQLDKDYWGEHSAIGFIFALGTAMGLIVGAVIVYQILYTDVTDHLSEYATLKAMGYANSYLFSIVLQEALILSVMGFLPGFAIAQALYVVTYKATLLPMFMTTGRALMVFGLTVGMCGGSAALAMRKLKSADPADIF